MLYHKAAEALEAMDTCFGRIRDIGRIPEKTILAIQAQLEATRKKIDSTFSSLKIEKDEVQTKSCYMRYIIENNALKWRVIFNKWQVQLLIDI